MPFSGTTSTLAERLWDKVTKTKSCWLWTGAKLEGGYGLISLGRRGEGTDTVHRVVWTLVKGPIPEGLQVLHKCDVRNCVRPSHLFLGTQADNIQDCIRKGRRAA